MVQGVSEKTASVVLMIRSLSCRVPDRGLTKAHYYVGFYSSHLNSEFLIAVGFCTQGLKG